MKAEWMPQENYWQVTDGERWWTAHRAGNPHGWFIANESLRLIAPSSRLGRQIIKAVDTAIEQGSS